MKPDDFEQRLQRQPLRQIPAEWRTEMLGACREPKAESRMLKRHWLLTVKSQLSTLFWPHPRAWAGLAAVWVLILALDFSTPGKTAIVTGNSAPPSPEVVAQLKLQQRMLVELIGSTQEADATVPKFLPLPRSERTEILMT